MPLPKIDIQLQQGGLGSTPSVDDGIMGLILQGVAVASGVELNTPYQIFSLKQAVDELKIDENYDIANSVNVYRHLKEFYDAAGTGAELWILVTSQTIAMDSLVDINEGNYAVNLLDAANGRVKVLGVTRSPDVGYTPDVTNGIDQEAFDALITGQILAETYNDRYKPFRIILEGRSYTGTPGDLTDLKTDDKNRSAIFIGSTLTDGSSSVGLLLGKISNIPVQRNVGRVKDGSLPITDAYLSNGVTVEGQELQLDAVHDKGYMLLRFYQGRAGYFLSDDPMATADTDDYKTLANGRVIDKAYLLTYITYVNELLDEIGVTENGNILPSIAGNLQTNIETVIDQQMTSGGEISSVSAFVDPEQNILSTGEIKIILEITPVGYAKKIIVEIGFVNPALN